MRSSRLLSSVSALFALAGPGPAPAATPDDQLSIAVRDEEPAPGASHVSRQPAGYDVTNARLRHPAERMAVAHAIRGAARRLEQSGCQGLLDEFTDASGRPLRAVLAAKGANAGEFLRGVLFYDAPPVACQAAGLAGTTEAGSRVIRVCGRRFARVMHENANYAEAVIVHEMLHSLGLGENPPTSYYITSRVLALCER